MRSWNTTQKRPRSGHNIQRMWRNIDVVRVCLTFMTLPYMSAAIAFHGEPIITGPKDFSGHSMPIGMCPKGTLVDLLNHEVRLFGIYASYEGHVVVSFVQDGTTYKETSSQSPQRPFVIVRNPWWVFLVLDILLDVEIPRFPIPLFLYCITICRLP